MAENGRRKGADALVLGLASGLTLRDAATAAGISERTAARHAADPEVRRRVGELRAAAVARALGKLADGMVEAADTLRGLLGSESDTVRLRAAAVILEAGSRLREAVEFETRLAALEEQAARQGDTP